MTNRERVIAALAFQKTDYVPYEVIPTQQTYDRMIQHTGDPAYWKKLNHHICQVEITSPLEEIEPEFFQDEFGVVWNRTGADKDIGVVDSYILEDVETAEDLLDFMLPPIDEANVRRSIEALAAAGDVFRMASLGFSLFERAWTLRGMENLLCDMLTEPELVHALMEKITRRNLKMLDIALSYDCVDAIRFGDDWGAQSGLIMGPQCWRTFIKPYVARMYDRVHQAGKYVVQHSCGDIRLVMEDLWEIGLNMYQTFQPEIYGYEYGEKLRGKITIWGGISTQRDLPCKTPDQIRAVTRELLAAFPEGGLVAAPTHDIPGDVPPENILAMLDVLDHQV